LIRDCQQEVYELFVDKIFLNLVMQININELEVLDKIFNILAFSLKYFMN
jgi:hypothetical protein